MSDSNVEKIELVLPSKMVLAHEGSEFVEAEQKAQSEQLKKAKAVLFLDKVAQEKLIKELEPKIKDAKEDVTEAKKVIEVLGQEVVDAIDVKSEFDAVKKALRALKITKCSFKVELEHVNIDTSRIHFKRVIVGKEGSSSYSTDELVGEDVLPFTADMKEARKAFLVRQAELDAMEKQYMDAQDALRNRANRMADVEGAMALKGLNEDDRADVKELYKQLATGLSATKLLGE
jgi:hypothetical protein